MPRSVLKLADDEYVQWSTITDSPVTYACDRAEAVETWGEAEVARADADTPEDVRQIICPNRAGANEEELTLEQIREQFSHAAGEAFARTAEGRRIQAMEP